MAQFKLIVSDRKGRTIAQELKDRTAQPLLGTKVGSTIDSSIVGVAGGKLKITGGSDRSGTPMRGDVHGGVKKYVLLSTGVGNRNEDRIRKLVRGNMVTEEIYQLNSMLIEGTLPEKQEAVESTGTETEPANKKH
ncbi:MAG TPA: S6e family ribosomal protein [Nitrososphaera sp.]|nr:S6e family ribosomal protein [Nitrososphaera sp.]